MEAFGINWGYLVIQLSIVLVIFGAIILGVWWFIKKLDSKNNNQSE